MLFMKIQFLNRSSSKPYNCDVLLRFDIQDYAVKFISMSVEGPHKEKTSTGVVMSNSNEVKGQIPEVQ